MKPENLQFVATLLVMRVIPIASKGITWPEQKFDVYDGETMFVEGGLRSGHVARATNRLARRDETTFGAECGLDVDDKEGV